MNTGVAARLVTDEYIWLRGSRLSRKSKTLETRQRILIAKEFYCYLARNPPISQSLNLSFNLCVWGGGGGGLFVFLVSEINTGSVHGLLSGIINKIHKTVYPTLFTNNSPR